MNKVEAAEAYRWLSPGDHFAKHTHIKSSRAPGTLQWLVDSPQFQRWLDHEQQVLLCTGKPGSGKTVATSLVVDTLFEKFGFNLGIGIAFLYHAYGQEDQNPERFLRSVLYQLGHRLRLIPTALIDLYRRYNNSASSPSVQELLGIIFETISKMSKVYLVIDALDELKSSHRRVLLSGLLKLQENLHVSLFATSRGFPDVVNRFQQFPSLEISGSLNLSYATLIFKHKFLHAKVLLDELATAQSPKSLSWKLSGLPVSPELHELYAEMMSRIERMVKEDRTLAKTALAWLLFARRPLKEAAFQHALGIQKGLSELDNDKVPDTIQIVALSAEYLWATQNDWWPEAKAMIAKYCLTYLAFDDIGQGYCKTDEEFEARLRENPLYEYAAQYWVDHLRDTPDLPERAITSFLIDQWKVASASQAMQWSEHESREQGYSQKIDHKQTGLHLAAQFGLESVIDLLLVAGQRPAVRDSKGLTPLWRATEESHEAVIRLLSRVDRTTFTVMLAEQEFSLAYSLLRHAGQTVKDTRLRTALHLGVIHNAPELIQNALKYGVDINAKDGDAYSPLQLAIQYQYDLSGKDQWMTLDYLSTLQSGSMPDSGMAFFNDLRPDVLNANGKQTTLINRLLDDANTWITLRHQLRKQAETARTFRKHYLKFADGDEAVGLLDRTIETFADRIALRIDKFDAASSALIQLEFNLTSIREAQKSTMLNRSIKRLTWITFVFLPLIFVSGLFGMNVNVLAGNPPWWWYVVFMLGTLCLTMAVWVAFKRFPELEDNLEDKFGWLVKPRRPKGQSKDVEKGWVADRKEKNI
ncbi:hypothetical protein N0V83_000182 [Neocucurbitaria cava]|uniref:Nephrocystin 3-like N-terminal domain-containing protein n=1 Tax=Neocucurbitaria cava TaxID=798079 RepID=A0A9W8YJD4_9PLEO|nr:hypothetical protein N0V83_000182 [Neocucurbitaria cava]